MPDYNDFAKGAPTMVYGEGPQDWLFYDEFNELNISASGSSYTGTEKWTHLSTDSGNTAKLVNTVSGGVLALTYSTPTDEDVIHLLGNGGVITGTGLQAGQPIRFGCRFQVADADSIDVHIGLSILDQSMAAGAPADWVGFRVLAADATGAVSMIVSKDSVVQTFVTGAVLADATWCRAWFEFVPTTGNMDSGTLHYTLHSNGTVIRGSQTIVNTWPDDVWIAPLIAVQIEGTDGDVGYVDWIYAHGIRNTYTEGTG